MEGGATNGGLLSRLLPRYAENRPLLAYVLLVVGGGLGLLAWRFPGFSAIVSWPFLLWLVFCVAAEFLWLETLSGEGTESMATTFNLGVLCLLAPDLSIWVVALSVFLATRLLQKRDWVRTFFGLGQMAWTASVCAMVFHAIHPEPPSLQSFREPLTSVAMAATCVIYFFANTFLVAGAVSLERRTPLLSTWQKNWGYRNAVVTSLALFTLSPIMILSYLSLGYAGVVLFFVPLLIVKNQNREYIHLQQMTQELVSSERMAAKGEIARKVAHEINNFLGVMSGRAQLLQLKAQRIGDESMKADAEIIRQQVNRMSTLAKDLMELKPELSLQRLELNRLVLETIDYISPQSIYEGIELVPELDPEVGDVQADPIRLQQVMINVCKNGAEAMRAAESLPGPMRITLRTKRAAHGTVRVEIKDSGPGMPRSVAEKIFEGFTTKKTGHGFGLATCYQILKGHGGRLWVESELGDGAMFVLELPKKTKATASGEVAPAAAKPKAAEDETRGAA